jgi:uncharacterized membrane protein
LLEFSLVNFEEYCSYQENNAMTRININTLHPAGTDLFNDSETFMTAVRDLSEDELRITGGGGGNSSGSGKSKSKSKSGSGSGSGCYDPCYPCYH